jgi:hypothetical protein
MTDLKLAIANYCAMQDWDAAFVVAGEPASKANSRRLVTQNGRPRFIKASKALSYAKGFVLQCPRLDPLLKGDIEVVLHIFYASRRPDMDESVILDCMQGLIYENDRQVKCRSAVWGLDRQNPHTQIFVREYT